MKRRLFSLALIQIITLTLFASISLPAEEAVQSAWTASPLRIDGQIEDWAGAAVTSAKGAGVDYAFRNDGRDLYILLIFKDPKFLSSIDKTGITIYASTSGKKDKDWGVHFIKKAVSGEQLIEYMEKMGQPLAEERKLQLKDAPQIVLFTGTAVNKKGEKVFPPGPVPDINLPGFRYGQQENSIVYEFRISLASRDVHPAGIGAEPGKDLKIGFEWGGMTKEMKEAMKGQPRGTATGADANIDEQTTGTNILDSPLSTGPTGPKKYSFWADVKLAQAQ